MGRGGFELAPSQHRKRNDTDSCRFFVKGIKVEIIKKFFISVIHR